MGLRSGTVVVASLAPAVVVAVDPGGWFPFGPAKWLVVSVLVPLGGALVLARRPLRLTVAPTAAVLVLVAWLAVTAAAGVEPLYAWTGTPERHFGVLTWGLCGLAFLVGQSLAPEQERNILGGGLAVAGLATGAVAAVEALGWEPSMLDVASGRLTGSFGSAAYLGAASALLLPALIGLGRDPGTPRRLRLVAVSGWALLIIAVIGSGARAAWVGLVVAALVTGWVRRRHLALTPWRVFAGAAAVAIVLLATPAGDRIASTFDAGEPGGRGRLDEWRVATNVLEQHPLVGVGPEGYRVAFAAGVDDAYERAHGRDPLPDRAHAGPLDIAIIGGLPALIAWLAVVTLVGRRVARALADQRRWLVGVAAALVAHVAGQLLLFPLAELEPLAFLLAGVVVTATTPEPLQRSYAVPRIAVGAVAVLAVAALAAGVVDIAADRRAAAAVAAMERGDRTEAVDQATAAVRLRPDVIRLRLLEARVLLVAERGTAAALAAVERALDISPGDPIALFDRVELLVGRAQATLVPAHIDAARSEVERLLGDDPHNAGLWLQAGVVARLDGDRAAAARAWERAEALAPTSPEPATNLALLHLESGRVDDALAAVERALTRAPNDERARQVLAEVQRAR